MQKTVKLSCGNEIRRLSLAQEATYHELVEEIQVLTKDSCPRFALKYKDDEGDMITITTDKELTEAFSQTDSGKPLRLVLVDLEKKEPYKKLKELVLKLVLPTMQEAKRTLVQVDGTFTLEAPLAEAEPTTSEETVVDEPDCTVYEELPTTEVEETEQEGVYHQAYCNNCMRDIYNVRYKCANCDDFDLCEECEAAWSENLSMHDTTHVFLKIYYPISTSYTQTLMDNLYQTKDEESSEDESEDESEDSDDSSSNDDNSSSSSEEESEDESESSSSEDESESEDEPKNEEDQSASESEDEMPMLLSETELVMPVLVAAEPDDFIEPEDKDEDEEDEAENVVYEENLIETPVLEGEEEAAPLLPETEPQVEDQIEDQVEEPQVEEPVVESQIAQPQPEQRNESGISSFLRAVQRFISGGDENTPASRAELLLLLDAMGFQDKERNETLLQRSGDNIDVVIDLLLA